MIYWKCRRKGKSEKFPYSRNISCRKCLKCLAFDSLSLVRFHAALEFFVKPRKKRPSEAKKKAKNEELKGQEFTEKFRFVFFLSSPNLTQLITSKSWRIKENELSSMGAKVFPLRTWSRSSAWRAFKVG